MVGSLSFLLSDILQHIDEEIYLAGEDISMARSTHALPDKRLNAIEAASVASLCSALLILRNFRLRRTMLCFEGTMGRVYIIGEVNPSEP